MFDEKLLADIVVGGIKMNGLQRESAFLKNLDEYGKCRSCGNLIYKNFTFS